MLIYGKYAVEKVDSLNYQVFKLGTNGKTGEDAKRNITYHGTLISALRKVRSGLQADALSSESISLNDLIKKLDKADVDFMKFLDKFTVNKALEAIYAPPKEPRKEKASTDTPPDDEDLDGGDDEAA